MSEKRIIDLSESIAKSINEITNIESFISKIVNDDGFNKYNWLTQRRSENINSNQVNSYNFISSTVIITENEFYKIVGANRNKIFKNSGYYQKKLYSNYKQAQKEADSGYIADIFYKAETLRNNINIANRLMRNKRFKEEWQKNFGEITPSRLLKETGSMRQINTVKSIVE